MKVSPLKLALLFLVLILLAVAGKFLLAIAFNAVALIAYAIIAVVLVHFLPVLIYGLKVGARRTTTAITVADPLNALRVEFDDLRTYIEKQSGIISQAEGNLAHLKSVVSSSAGVLTEDRIKSWNDTIETQTKGIDYAKISLSSLITEKNELKKEIEAAKLELEMIDISNSVSNTIGAGEDRVLSERRKEAVNAIQKRTAQSKAKLNTAISQLELNRAA